MDLNKVFESYQTLSKELITIEGWVRNHRDQKSFGFLMMNDGTDFRSVQVVYDETTQDFESIKKIRTGAALSIQGNIVLTPDAKQPFEIKAAQVTVVGESPENYPIQPKRHSKEFLRTMPHLRLKTNLFSAVFKVRSILHHSIHRFFEENGFVHVAAPIITSSDAEGAGEMFQVTTLALDKIPKEKSGAIDYSQDFFGKSTNLTVSGQLQAEIFAQAFKNVYTFGPTFRAENSNTKTHASEFWMIEPEMAFSDLNKDMEVATKMVKYLIKDVLEKAKEEMAFFDEFVEKGLINKLKKVIETDFAVLTHKEAVETLIKSQKPFENTPSYKEDLATEHEKALVEIMDGPVYVIDWPKDIKAFYMRLNDDNETVAAMDLLVPGSGELIGGSQREERLDILLERMKAFNIHPEDMDWYLDLRRFGSTPHAGFGLGFDRMLMYLTGIENIRDVIPFPRTPKNCQL
jgi:asparaginyl-tRNA synthetase